MNFTNGTDKQTNRLTDRHISLALVELLLSQLKNAYVKVVAIAVIILDRTWGQYKSVRVTDYNVIQNLWPV